MDAAQLVHSYSATIQRTHDDLVAKAGAPGDDARQRQNELLAKYQVRPDETTKWPGWPLSMAQTPVELTKAEAAMLDNLFARQGVSGLQRFKSIKEEAERAAKGAFGGQGRLDGHADSFRHAYWNALMTQEYGEPWANQFATSHERYPDNNPIPVAMDLHNNEVGRQIALAHPNATTDEMKGLIDQAVRDGRMLVIDKNDMLVPSNTVAPGDTRVSDDAHPWPTDNPQRGDDTDPGAPNASPGY
ncbi:DUF6973 domain-containing protein [Labedaea rhizosphaerae]|uniref:DUF6973 domain-containing protein n=1 Tax=Labedaea rhizosphaerae TaxID=598644 RepID=A0A4R6SHW8_LABRH|nr:hypothetical protein [Labedaea rhizosphaerae]TDQ01415.1 hypothetical protein EV186_1021283 [Labedaea rhizosphaerae]